MTARRLLRRFSQYLTIILGAVSAVDGSEKFSINDQAVQILKIAEDTAHAINGIEIVMQPSYFNYLVPFSTTVTCSDGTMDVSGMDPVHLEESYMVAINESQSYIQARFAVANLTYKYDSCWLNFGLPVPIWLHGKILHSQYFVSATLHYKPKCRIDIQKAQLLTYDKLTVNILQWMPGVIGEWLLEAITKNAQDRIFATVEKSIQTNAEELSDTYDPCIVFPSMGKMAPYVPYPEHDKTETTSTLEESSYIGGLLDEISETEETLLENTENILVNISKIESNEDMPENYSKIENVTDNFKTEL